MTKKRLILRFDELPPIKNDLAWRAQINAALFSLDIANKRWNKTAMRALRQYLPYAIKCIGNNDHIFLNRSYKPLGMIGIWATYEFFPELFVKGSDPQLKEFLPKCELSNGMLFLFDDGDAPWLSKAATTRYIELLQLIR